MSGSNTEVRNECASDALPGEPSALDNPLAWANSLMLSDEELESIADPSWAYENLIIDGHIILIPAEPNGGKTTVMAYVAGEIVKRGYSVYYINADISAGDAKSFDRLAREKGVRPIFPDLKLGESMESILRNLMDDLEKGHRFDRTVFVFDTLKKIIDVLNKQHAKLLFEMLRKLTGRGMTIVLLAHTNKHKDINGDPIYEGTGDMRADVDEMIYFLPVKNTDGSMTVTTKPDKVRGSFAPISFEIDGVRNVRPAEEVVDVDGILEARTQMEADAGVIDAIQVAIAEGARLQKDIVEACRHADIGERRVKAVLAQYCRGVESEGGPAPLWFKQRGDKNSYTYSLLC